MSESVAELLFGVWKCSDILEMKIEGIKQKASWNQGRTTRVSVEECNELLQFTSSIKNLVKQIEEIIGLRR